MKDMKLHVSINGYLVAANVEFETPKDHDGRPVVFTLGSRVCVFVVDPNGKVLSTSGDLEP